MTLGADGFVPVNSLGAEYFIYDQTSHSMRGERSGQLYQLGDRVEVKLIEAAPVSGGLRFEMVSGGRQGVPAKRQTSRLSKQTPKKGRRK